MRIRKELQELADQKFVVVRRWRLAGTKEMAERIVKSVAHDAHEEPDRFGVEEGVWSGAFTFLKVRARGATGVTEIGFLQFLEAPRQFVWMQIPRFRGGNSTETWPNDPSGELFASFITRLLEEYEHLGFLSPSAPLRAREIVDTAYQQLYVSDDPSSYAAVGNMARRAVIALANDLYSDEMLPHGATTPKADNAKERLTYFVRNRVASDRFRGGIEEVISGSWKMASAFLHRKTATLEEAEVCLGEVSALVDSMAYLQGGA